MNNLIKIELKKFSAKSHLIGLLIANVVMIGLLIPIFLFAPESEYVDKFAIVSTLNISVFIVWQGALIAKLVIEEFSNKTMFLLFTYPVSRKKLIVAKLAIVNSTILFSMLVSQAVQTVAFSALGQLAPQVSFSPSVQDMGAVAILSVGAVMMGMLSLCVGMINKSAIATIVSSLAVVAIMGTTVGEAGGLLMSVPISLSVGAVGAVGVALAFIALKDIDKKDLLV